MLLKHTHTHIYMYSYIMFKCIMTFRLKNRFNCKKEKQRESLEN